MSPRKGVEFTPLVRERVVERDLNRCMRCGRWLGMTVNLHHRRLRSQGGLGLPENGATLCGSGTTGCHGWVHANVAQAILLGFIVPSWEEPATTPVRTWRGWMLLHDDFTWNLTEDPTGGAAGTDHPLVGADPPE